MKHISIYLADDHPAVIEGLSRHLADAGGFVILGVATNGEDLLADSKAYTADVIILDLNMPKVDGVAVLVTLRENGYQGKIVINSSYQTKELVNDVVSKGADGFLSKSSQLDELIDILIRVYNGEKIFPKITREIMNESSYYLHDDFLKKYKLTKREVEVISLICKNKKTKEIAQELNISEFTVSTHRKNIVFKLGIGDSIIDLFEFAKKHNIID